MLMRIRASSGTPKEIARALENPALLGEIAAGIRKHLHLTVEDSARFFVESVRTSLPVELPAGYQRCADHILEIKVDEVPVRGGQTHANFVAVAWMIHRIYKRAIKKQLRIRQLLEMRIIITCENHRHIPETSDSRVLRDFKISGTVDPAKFSEPLGMRRSAAPAAAQG
jgi:hypothetical protein